MMRVGVVILNYKVLDKAKTCLNSVLKSDYPELKIYILDNNSKDGSDEYFTNEEKVVFIQTGSNLGYSGGNNIGVKKALSDGADAVFVLNPDTAVEKETISKLVEALKDNIGIVGPKIYFSGTKTIWFAGGIFDKLNVLGSHRGVDMVDKGVFDKAESVDFITGAAMMVRSDVFEKIGFFDEKYFLYYEDADFCFRAREAGFKIIYEPKALVYHENAGSTKLGSPLQDYFITRNRLLFAKKFLPLRTQFALVREAIRNLSNSTRRMAFLDFLLNNLKGGSFIHD